MRVVQISQNFHLRGGADRYFLDLCGLLEARGHEVMPFSAAHPANLATPASDYFPPGADFDRAGPSDILTFLWSPRAREGLRRLLGDFRPDIVHLHVYYGKLTSSILGPLSEFGAPVVQTLHDFRVVCPTGGLFRQGRICEDCQGDRFHRAVSRRCNRGSLARSALSALESYLSLWMGGRDVVDRFLAVSEFQRRKLIALGMDGSKLETVPNYIDATRTRVAEEQGSYVLFFGRVERSKGVFTLLDAIEPLTGIACRIVGWGEALQDLRREIERRGIRHVEAPGPLWGEDLDAAIRGSLFSVQPAEAPETFGLTVLESYARGRTVIASRLGGLAELVRHQEDGLTFAPGSVDELRACIVRLVENPAERNRLASAARARTLREFSAEAHYDRVMAVYQSLLASVPDPGHSSRSLHP